VTLDPPTLKTQTLSRTKH